MSQALNRQDVYWNGGYLHSRSSDNRTVHFTPLNPDDTNLVQLDQSEKPSIISQNTILLVPKWMKDATSSDKISVHHVYFHYSIYSIILIVYVGFGGKGNCPIDRSSKEYSRIDLIESNESKRFYKWKAWISPMAIQKMVPNSTIAKAIIGNAMQMNLNLNKVTLSLTSFLIDTSASFVILKDTIGNGSTINNVVRNSQFPCGFSSNDTKVSKSFKSEYDLELLNSERRLMLSKQNFQKLKKADSSEYGDDHNSSEYGDDELYSSNYEYYTQTFQTVHNSQKVDTGKRPEEGNPSDEHSDDEIKSSTYEYFSFDQAFQKFHGSRKGEIKPEALIQSESVKKSVDKAKEKEKITQLLKSLREFMPEQYIYKNENKPVGSGLTLDNAKYGNNEQTELLVYQFILYMAVYPTLSDDVNNLIPALVRGIHYRDEQIAIQIIANIIKDKWPLINKTVPEEMWEPAFSAEYKLDSASPHKEFMRFVKRIWRSVKSGYYPHTYISYNSIPQSMKNIFDNIVKKRKSWMYKIIIDGYNVENYRIPNEDKDEDMEIQFKKEELQYLEDLYAIHKWACSHGKTEIVASDHHFSYTLCEYLEMYFKQFTDALPFTFWNSLNIQTLATQLTKIVKDRQKSSLKFAKNGIKNKFLLLAACFQHVSNESIEMNLERTFVHDTFPETIKHALYYRFPERKKLTTMDDVPSSLDAKHSNFIKQMALNLNGYDMKLYSHDNWGRKIFLANMIYRLEQKDWKTKICCYCHDKVFWDMLISNNGKIMSWLINAFADDFGDIIQTMHDYPNASHISFIEPTITATPSAQITSFLNDYYNDNANFNFLEAYFQENRDIITNGILKVLEYGIVDVGCETGDTYKEYKHYILQESKKKELPNFQLSHNPFMRAIQMRIKTNQMLYQYMYSSDFEMNIKIPDKLPGLFKFVSVISNNEHHLIDDQIENIEIGPMFYQYHYKRFQNGKLKITDEHHAIIHVTPTYQEYLKGQIDSSSSSSSEKTFIPLGYATEMTKTAFQLIEYVDANLLTSSSDHDNDEKIQKIKRFIGNGKGENDQDKEDSPPTETQMKEEFPGFMMLLNNQYNDQYTQIINIILSIGWHGHYEEKNENDNLFNIISFQTRCRVEYLLRDDVLPFSISPRFCTRSLMFYEVLSKHKYKNDLAKKYNLISSRELYNVQYSPQFGLFEYDSEPNDLIHVCVDRLERLQIIPDLANRLPNRYLFEYVLACVYNSIRKNLVNKEKGGYETPTEIKLSNYHFKYLLGVVPQISFRLSVDKQAYSNTLDDDIKYITQDDTYRISNEYFITTVVEKINAVRKYLSSYHEYFDIDVFNKNLSEKINEVHASVHTIQKYDVREYNAFVDITKQIKNIMEKMRLVETIEDWNADLKNFQEGITKNILYDTWKLSFEHLIEKMNIWINTDHLSRNIRYAIDEIRNTNQLFKFDYDNDDYIDNLVEKKRPIFQQFLDQCQKIKIWKMKHGDRLVILNFIQEIINTYDYLKVHGYGTKWQYLSDTVPETQPWDSISKSWKEPIQVMFQLVTKDLTQISKSSVKRLVDKFTEDVIRILSPSNTYTLESIQGLQDLLERTHETIDVIKTSMKENVVVLKIRLFIKSFLQLIAEAIRLKEESEKDDSENKTKMIININEKLAVCIGTLKFVSIEKHWKGKIDINWDDIVSTIKNNFSTTDKVKYTFNDIGVLTIIVHAFEKKASNAQLSILLEMAKKIQIDGSFVDTLQTRTLNNFGDKNDTPWIFWPLLNHLIDFLAAIKGHENSSFFKMIKYIRDDEVKELEDHVYIEYQVFLYNLLKTPHDPKYHDLIQKWVKKMMKTIMIKPVENSNSNSKKIRQLFLCNQIANVIYKYTKNDQMQSNIIVNCNDIGVGNDGVANIDQVISGMVHGNGLPCYLLQCTGTTEEGEELINEENQFAAQLNIQIVVKTIRFYLQEKYMKTDFLVTSKIVEYVMKPIEKYLNDGLMCGYKRIVRKKSIESRVQYNPFLRIVGKIDEMDRFIVACLEKQENIPMFLTPTSQFCPLFKINNLHIQNDDKDNNIQFQQNVLTMHPMFYYNYQVNFRHSQVLSIYNSSQDVPNPKVKIIAKLWDLPASSQLEDYATCIKYIKSFVDVNFNDIKKFPSILKVYTWVQKHDNDDEALDGSISLWDYMPLALVCAVTTQYYNRVLQKLKQESTEMYNNIQRYGWQSQNNEIVSFVDDRSDIISRLQYTGLDGIGYLSFDENSVITAIEETDEMDETFKKYNLTFKTTGQENEHQHQIVEFPTVTSYFNLYTITNLNQETRQYTNVTVNQKLYEMYLEKMTPPYAKSTNVRCSERLLFEICFCKIVNQTQRITRPRYSSAVLSKFPTFQWPNGIELKRVFSISQDLNESSELQRDLQRLTTKKQLEE